MDSSVPENNTKNENKNGLFNRFLTTVEFLAYFGRTDQLIRFEPITFFHSLFHS